MATHPLAESLLARLPDRETAARYRALVEGNLLGVVVADVDAIREANDEFLRMIGCSREELDAGQVDWKGMTPPEWLPSDIRALEDLAARGAAAPYEKEFVRRDGSRVPFLVGASALEREPLRWICFTIDLTRQKQLEQRILRLQEANAALSAAASPAEVAQAILRVGVRAVGATAGSVSRLVHEPEGVLVQVLDSVGYAPEMLQRWQQIPLDARTPLTDACRSGNPVWVRDGAERAARYAELNRAAPGRDDFRAWAAIPLVVEHRVLGALGFSFSETRAFDEEEQRFVTAFADKCAQALDRAQAYESERLARRAAERSAERTSRLLRITDALARVHSAAEVASVMVSAGIDALGADAGLVAELLPDGATLELIASRGYPAELERTYSRFTIDAPIAAAACARTRQPSFFANRRERQAMLGGDVPTPYSAVLAAPLIAHGQLLGSWALSCRQDRELPAEDRDFFLALTNECAMALDRARAYDAERTARAEAERARLEAERANAAKSQFLATMSHELRTPLNAITGHTQLLSMGLHGPVSAAQEQALSRIDHASRHLLRLINDVLNMARIEAGHVSYTLRPLRVADVAGDLAALVLPQFRAKSIEFRTSFPEDLPGVDPVLVRADREKLVQVLTNLLGNAAKFTPDGGEVELSLHTRPDEPELAYIAVRDTGPGIPPDKLASIFDPFVQVDRSLTSPQEGTGLGLAIARELALGMGGDIRVRSVPGRGATFTVTLRRA